MHRYLKSLGFSGYKTEQQVDKLLTTMEQNFFDTAHRYLDPDGQMHMEIRAEIAPGIGICIVGVLDEKSRKKIPFRRLTYYPYATSDDVSSNAVAQLFHRVNDELLSGILEDPRVGVTLIFLLDNPFDYFQKVGDGNETVATSTNLVGFSRNGRILLPNLQKSKVPASTGADGAFPQAAQQPQAPQEFDLMDALKSGDHAAIEQAALMEMSNLAELGKRLQREDIYSIVESVFMPQGIECDTYSIIGEILDVDYATNNMTGEGIYDLTLNVNGMKLHILTSEQDLEGEPDIGRRFKGTIWLQGRVQM